MPFSSPQLSVDGNASLIAPVRCIVQVSWLISLWVGVWWVGCPCSLSRDSLLVGTSEQVTGTCLLQMAPEHVYLATVVISSCVNTSAKLHPALRLCARGLHAALACFEALPNTKFFAVSNSTKAFLELCLEDTGPLGYCCVFTDSKTWKKVLSPLHAQQTPSVLRLDGPCCCLSIITHMKTPDKRVSFSKHQFSSSPSDL